MRKFENAIGSVLRNAATKAERLPKGENDFQKEGLLHCGECGMPKQCRVKLLNNTVKVRCMCQCEEKAYQEERKRAAAIERMMRSQQMRTQGMQDENVKKYTFDNAEPSKTLDKCRRYVERWSDMLRHGQGLLFWGGVGTGKTYAAACIANALIDRGVPAMVTSFPKILNAGFDKSEIVRGMQRFDLVVLDDFGVERGTEYSAEIMQFVLDERYKSGKPLIITTNLNAQELKNPKTLSFARMFDRINEMCAPVYFGGESKRKKKAEDRMRFAREVFADD